MSLSNAKLEFWAKNRYNVCLSGRHGVGKTGQVFQLFNNLYGELGKDWLYFSAATMDPWVDFIGVPKEGVAEDGTSYLYLVRPEVFARDQVKAIFLDEYNRAPKKIRNSVMELIQFGSINGHKFNNLEVVWTAINPPNDDEDDLNYDVDEIDPAQLDRFHIFVEVPYKVSKSYFNKKYGVDSGNAAVEWWESLPHKIKELVSPRRLDYAVDCYVRGGDIRDILPKEANSSQLLYTLSEGSVTKILSKLKKEKDDKATEKKLSEENFYNLAINAILKDDGYISYFFPLLPSEKIAAFISSSNKKELDRVLDNVKTSVEFLEKINPLIESRAIVNNKIKTLESWKRVNFAVSTTLEKFDRKKLTKLLGELTNRQNVPYFTTPDRISHVQQLTDAIISMEKNGEKITPAQAKKCYDNLLYFVHRSQMHTFNKVEYAWIKAIKIVNNNYPFSSFEKSIENSFFSNYTHGITRLEKWNIILDEHFFNESVDGIVDDDDDLAELLDILARR